MQGHYQIVKHPVQIVTREWIMEKLWKWIIENEKLEKMLKMLIKVIFDCFYHVSVTRKIFQDHVFCYRIRLM